MLQVPPPPRPPPPIQGFAVVSPREVSLHILCVRFVYKADGTVNTNAPRTPHKAMLQCLSLSIAQCDHHATAAMTDAHDAQAAHSRNHNGMKALG